MSRIVNPSPDFWCAKRVLITGHTGFKGSWLSLWLSRLGAHVTGVSLAPHTDPSLFVEADVGNSLAASHFADIRDPRNLASLLSKAAPDIVFHLAAQPLVRYSYREPLETFAVNVQGTVNILDAVCGCPDVRVVVAITTDKVYRNDDRLYPYRETDELGGHDPYSASKAAAELVIASYRQSFLEETGVAVASARAGNVIGGGDWSEDRLIPDAVRAWTSASPLEVRRPSAVRPWQHVLEPLLGYLRLAEILAEAPDRSGAFNFGPLSHDAASVRNVIELAHKSFPNGGVLWGAELDGPHEEAHLTLEPAKSRTTLGVMPRWGVREGIERTMTWYSKFYEGADARELCDADFEVFEGKGAVDNEV